MLSSRSQYERVKSGGERRREQRKKFGVKGIYKRDDVSG
jgi:hypothetical protein